MKRENASSTRPRNAPIITEIMTTMVVRRLVSSLVGQLTLRSSAMASAKKRNRPRVGPEEGIRALAGRVKRLIRFPWPSLSSVFFYLVSRWSLCPRQRGQYLENSNRPESFLRFLLLVYVLSRHSVQARWITTRTSLPLAIVQSKSPQGGLVLHLGEYSGPDGPAAFPNGETELLFYGDGGDEFDAHGDVVARHDHFGAFG